MLVCRNFGGMDQRSRLSEKIQMNVNRVRTSVRPRGFTLVELVVVVLIMGIIAAVALPKMATSTTTAKLNSAKQSLSTIRTAIELYKNDNGAYPNAAPTLPTLLAPYLKGPFPAAPVGANAGDATVVAGTSPATVVSGTNGWAYVIATGDFYLNDASSLAY
jgi:general secretion pathway protein G